MLDPPPPLSADQFRPDCHFGLECYNRQCKFVHPPEWNADQASEIAYSKRGDGDVLRRRGFSGEESDIANDVEGGGAGQTGGEMDSGLARRGRGRARGTRGSGLSRGAPLGR